MCSTAPGKGEIACAPCARSSRLLDARMRLIRPTISFPSASCGCAPTHRSPTSTHLCARASTIRTNPTLSNLHSPLYSRCLRIVSGLLLVQCSSFVQNYVAQATCRGFRCSYYQQKMRINTPSLCMIRFVAGPC